MIYAMLTDVLNMDLGSRMSFHMGAGRRFGVCGAYRTDGLGLCYLM